jgi:hypothetical protein
MAGTDGIAERWSRSTPAGFLKPKTLAAILKSAEIADDELQGLL